MDFTALREKARGLTVGAGNPQVKELVVIVEQLCAECAALEKRVEVAEREAHRAKLTAKRSAG